MGSTYSSCIQLLVNNSTFLRYFPKVFVFVQGFFICKVKNLIYRLLANMLKLLTSSVWNPNLFDVPWCKKGRQKWPPSKYLYLGFLDVKSTFGEVARENQFKRINKLKLPCEYMTVISRLYKKTLGWESKGEGILETLLSDIDVEQWFPL